MSAAIATVSQHRPLGRRLWNVVRLHLANPFTILGTPLIILGAIYAVNLVIWWVIAVSIAGSGGDTVRDVSEGMQYSGATLWIFVYMMVVAVQAMNLTFPFAMGFGVTRRDFYLGSSIAFVLLSAFYSIVFSIMSALETATDGWGLGGRMFSAIYFGGPETPWALQLFYVFALFLFFFFVGAAVAAMYVRWKQRGLIGFFLASGALILGSAVLITQTQSWGRIGQFFATLGFTGSYAASLVVTALAGLTGYLIMRRAAPRS